MATFTIYQSPPPFFLNFMQSDNATYLTARAGSGITSNSGLRVGQFTSGTFQIFEGVLQWDTSTVIGTITNAVMSIKTSATDTSTTDFTVEVRLDDWGGDIQNNTKWVAGANLGALTLLTSWPTSSWSASTFQDFTQSGTNLQDNINRTGFTRVVLNSDRTRLSTAPTNDEYLTFASTLTGVGTVNDPKLVITSTVTTSGDETLVPYWDVVTGSWTTDSGGTTSLYTAIDETSPSDADYVQSPIPSTPTLIQYYETGVEDHSDPVSSTGHIAHYRYQKNASGGNTNLTVDLFQGTGSQLTVDQATFDTSLADWTATGNNTISRDTDFFHVGPAGMKMTGNAGGTSRANLPTGTSARPVLGSTNYSIAAWFFAGGTVRTCGIDVKWYTSAGAFISTTTGPTITDSATIWTQTEITTVVSPSNAAYASLEVNATGTINFEAHYVDDILFRGPIAEWSHSNISNSWTTQNQTLSAAQADSITDYSNLRLRFTATPVIRDVVPAFVADRASANSNSAVTTVDLALSSLTVGNYLIIRTAADNSGGGGVARTFVPSNQVGSAMGTHTEYQQNNDPGAASAGVTCNISVIKIAATSGTIRLTYGGSVVQACVAEEWTGISSTTPVASNVGANGTASTQLAVLAGGSSLNGTTAYGVEAVEGPSSDTYTQDSDTTDGSWLNLTKLGTSNATADTNMTIYGGYKPSSELGGAQTYDPTINTARDSAGIILILNPGTATLKTQVSWANLELPAAPASGRQLGLSTGVDFGFGAF